MRLDFWNKRRDAPAPPVDTQTRLDEINEELAGLLVAQADLSREVAALRVKAREFGNPIQTIRGVFIDYPALDVPETVLGKIGARVHLLVKERAELLGL